jgi:cytochrome c biogenesis protein CcmG, thiol:disulfide interchange protein DsbE
MSARTLGVSLAVLAVTALLALLAHALLSEGGGSIAVGDQAPDKPLQVLGSEDKQTLADYRGRWVLLNFWASWCAPCRDEAPELEAFQKQYGGKDFTVLGVDLDDNTGDASEFVSKYGLSYPQLRDGDGRERREAYGMIGFPENFLIDPQGKLAVIHRGQVTQDFLGGQVAPLISGPRAEQ